MNIDRMIDETAVTAVEAIYKIAKANSKAKDEELKKLTDEALVEVVRLQDNTRKALQYIKQKEREDAIAAKAALLGYFERKIDPTIYQQYIKLLHNPKRDSGATVRKFVAEHPEVVAYDLAMQIEIQ